MWAKALMAGALAAAGVVAAGCHHDRYNLKVKAKEECVLPPSEARFDAPETAVWRPPPPKKEEKTLIGGGGNGKMGGPVGGPGGF